MMMNMMINNDHPKEEKKKKNVELFGVCAFVVSIFYLKYPSPTRLTSRMFRIISDFFSRPLFFHPRIRHQQHTPTPPTHDENKVVVVVVVVSALLAPSRTKGNSKTR